MKKPTIRICLHFELSTKIVAHKVGTQVEQAYNRSEGIAKRRALLERVGGRGTAAVRLRHSQGSMHKPVDIHH
jgi:hypothetical protein